MEVFARILLLLCRLVGFFLTPFVRLSYKRHQNVPVIRGDEICLTKDGMKPSFKQNLLLETASDLVMDIKNRKVRKNVSKHLKKCFVKYFIIFRLNV